MRYVIVIFLMLFTSFVANAQSRSMWMIGGGTYAQTIPRNFYNDVWKSADGINWLKVISDSAWKPRQYHSIISFDNKLWVIGGYDARHAASVYDFKNSIWQTAGYFRDVWRMIKKTSSLNLNHQTDTLLYTGDSLYLRTDRIIGGNYYWEKDNHLLAGLNENYITIKSTGKYKLVFTDLEGESISSSPLTFSFINKNIASFKDTTVLWDDTTVNIAFQVDSVDNAGYEWFRDGKLINNATSRFYSVDSAGTYYAKVRLPNEISISTDTARVNYYKPELSSSTGNFVLGEEDMRLIVQGIPGVKYEWYHNGVLISSLIDTSIAIDDIGTYNVMLTTSNGYSYSSDSIKISSEIVNRPTLEIKSASLANGNLRFEMFNNDRGRVIVELIEMTGRIFFRDEIDKSSMKLKYAKYISNLPKGYFAVRVTVNSKTGSTKIFN